MDGEAWEAVIDTAVRCRLVGAAYAAFRQAAWWFGSSAADEERIGALHARLGVIARHLIERMAPVDGPLNPDAAWNRPLVRNLVVMPCATGTPLRALLATATFLPLRVMDESLAVVRGAPSAGAFLPHLWRYAVRGATPTSGASSAARRPSAGPSPDADRMVP
jgi:hypothetical protein